MARIHDIYKGRTYKGKDLDGLVKRFYGSAAYIVWGEEQIVNNRKCNAWVWGSCGEKYARYDEPIAPVFAER